MVDGPFALVERLVDVLDDLDVPYALGGSLASSLFGEPRSTVDVDIAVVIDRAAGVDLLERVGEDFYVPFESALAAIDTHSSFNLVDTTSSLKVDLFVLGDGLLDRRQIERRVAIELPDSGRRVWVTSPEDQVLRKLRWFVDGGRASDRQWRDVVALLQVSGGPMDLDDLRTAAGRAGVASELRSAEREAGTLDG